MTVLKFLKKIILFATVTFFLSVCFVAIFFVYNSVSFKDLPAPNLSNSYSYNEKMEFLNAKTKDIRVIGVGSSMSLNNLNAETIIQKLNTDKYINASSWGMSFKDIFYLLRILNRVYPLNTVIVASNIGDIQSTDKIVKYDELSNYLKAKEKKSILYHFKLFDLKYYLTNFSYAKDVRSCENDYAYLGFNMYGEINFNRNTFHIDSARWNRNVIHDPIRSIGYSYLDSLSKYCKNQKLKLLFFQSPIRTGAYRQCSEYDLNKVREHTRKVETILKAYNHTFITTEDEYWSDDLFIDATHLNGEGAKVFTNYCFDKLSKKFLN